jgi:hypothetical protein
MVSRPEWVPGRYLSVLSSLRPKLLASASVAVCGIDELGVLLDDLPVFEISAQRPDPAARHRVVLVDFRPDAMPGPQPVSAAQPGDPRPDDDNSRGAPAIMS